MESEQAREWEEEKQQERERESTVHILKWKLARRTFYINVALKCAFCHNRGREREETYD